MNRKDVELLREFLFTGEYHCESDEEENVSPLTGIVEACLGFTLVEESSKDIIRQLKSELLSKKEEVLIQSEKLSMKNVVEKVKSYRELNHKIQLLEFVEKIQRLRHYRSVDHVTDIVLEILDALDASHLSFPESSRAAALAAGICRETSNELIEHFHREFEVHLGEKLSEADSRDLWKAFIVKSKRWMLSYLLVSLLPARVTEQGQVIANSFPEVLDEALTPLWGRFHFHLDSSRQAGTMEQLLWTFNYSKTFIQLLVDLIGHLTEEEVLQKLFPADYRLLAAKYVVEKSVRFLRAHVAEIFERKTDMEDNSFVLLLENILQIDYFLNNISPQYTLTNSVLFDARSIHCRWEALDRDYFVSSMQQILSSYGNCFSFQFGKRGSLSVAEASTRVAARQASYSGCRCYQGVYHSLRLYLAATDRYSILSKRSQVVFSNLVLEPLLVTIIVLFLIRLRASHDLYLLTNNEWEWPSYSLSLNRWQSAEFLALSGYVDDFMESVSYCEQALESAVHSQIATTPRNFDELWERLQRSIPKRELVDADVGLNGRFAPVELVSRAFRMSSQENGEDSSLKNISARNEVIDRSQFGTSVSGGSIADVVLRCRALIVTMKDVVEKEFLGLLPED